MSIQEVRGKFKDWGWGSDLLLVVVVVATAVSGFALGRLSMGESMSIASPNVPQHGSAITATLPEPVAPSPSVVPVAGEEASASSPATPPATMQYVASKSGTKYHLLTCAGAKQIKEENKIYFTSKAEAEASGYTPAANCKGI